jgi:hypothetical protein
VAAVWIAVEDGAVFRCPASRRARELILSLRGLVGLPAGGELCWDGGATVTNVTAGCLHETAKDRGKENIDRELSLWPERSGSTERRAGI